MPDESPALPGFERLAPRLRAPLPSNYPGDLFKISTERDIYMGIVACPATGATPDPLRPSSRLTDEQQLWEDAQGIITARRLMAHRDAVLWGCPEGDFSLLLSDERHPDFDTYSRSFSAVLHSTGRACLTRSGNRMIRSHPAMEVSPGNSYHDTPFDLAPGSYTVTVTQLFRWKSAQFARIHPGEIHYHVHFRPMSALEAPVMKELPWLAIDLPV